MRNILVSILLIAFLFSCSTSHQAQQDNTSHAKPAPNQALIWATLWQQRAAEYKALCLQAYNVAHDKLQQFLDTANSNTAYAVVTDIDETVLLNGAYEAQEAMQGQSYSSASWEAWTAKAAADTIPGALGFFNYALSRGVQVFYITNRDDKALMATIQNLQRFHFPDADEAHVLVSTNGSSDKTPRRQQVEQQYKVILFLGDNLGDFSHVFDHQPMDKRAQLVFDSTGLFGRKWIVLPNDMYGEWEGAYYKYDYGLTPQQKDSVRQSLLITK